MARKFLIECPICGRMNEATDSFFARRKIECNCGHIIDVKKEKMVTKQCQHCGNLIVYNKAKNPDPVCPVCHEKLVNEKDDWKFVEVICPECSCHIIANKEDQITTCPLCGEHIDIKARLKEQQYLDEKQPTILKCEVGSEVGVWKHPSEDFAFGSQIIVNESQTAVFLGDGAVAGVFGPGKHMVTIDNLTINHDNFDAEDVTFHSQLFFVSNVIQVNQRWGTNEKIRMFDPASGLHVELGACGFYSYKISDVQKFLFYIIGLGSVEEVGIKCEDVSLKVRPNIINVVKSDLAKSIRENGINILEVDEHTRTIAEVLLPVINKDISKLGIELTDFIISSVITPDNDPNFKRMKEQYAERYLKVTDENIKKAEAIAKHDRVMVETESENEVELAKAKTEAEIARIKAQGEADAYRAKAGAEADEMRMKGYTYQDETTRKVATGAVQHMDGSTGDGSGISGLATDAVKISIIKEAGKEISKEVIGAMNGTSSPAQPEAPKTWDCVKCGTKGITTNFCPNCGEKRPAEAWNCPDCGTTGITSNFCPNCGKKR